MLVSKSSVLYPFIPNSLGDKSKQENCVDISMDLRQYFRKFYINY